MKQLKFIKILFTSLFITGCINIALAQGGAKVSGALQDTQGKPMDYASVSIIAAKDSATVLGTLSTERGTYQFDHIKAGSYLIKATVVGYKPGLSQVFTVTDTTKSISIALIKMAATSKQLSTVVITATKPMIEHLADKTVVNVAGSVLATGNTAMDILERAPGVTVDKDDNISLKGKQGVTVMINDKLTYLSATQLATLLRSTDGGTIQSIELITNPSAKYDAAGNSGIINIKLKK